MSVNAVLAFTECICGCGGIKRPIVMKRPSPKRFFRHNGLSLVLAGLFLLTYLFGQTLTGFKVYNQERVEHHEPALSLWPYLKSAHFIEVTAENWESEFFQMFIYVYITTFLFQKGSAESKDPDRPDEKRPVTPASPWPVRRGGWWRKIYEHSLSLAFALLFLVAFVLHAFSSTALENEQRSWSGLPPVTLFEHLVEAQFWFESFQNWQSEFLAIGSMVFLSIFLREKNSPESKDVESPHHETGG